MTPQQAALFGRAARNDEVGRKGLQEMGKLIRSHRKERARDS
jgi:hypothetical protein